MRAHGSQLPTPGAGHCSGDEQRAMLSPTPAARLRQARGIPARQRHGKRCLDAGMLHFVTQGTAGWTCRFGGWKRFLGNTESRTLQQLQSADPRGSTCMGGTPIKHRQTLKPADVLALQGSHVLREPRRFCNRLRAQRPVCLASASASLFQAGKERKQPGIGFFFFFKPACKPKHRCHV